MGGNDILILARSYVCTVDPYSLILEVCNNNVICQSGSSNTKRLVVVFYYNTVLYC